MAFLREKSLLFFFEGRDILMFFWVDVETSGGERFKRVPRRLLEKKGRSVGDHHGRGDADDEVGEAFVVVVEAGDVLLLDEGDCGDGGAGAVLEEVGDDALPAVRVGAAVEVEKFAAEVTGDEPCHGGVFQGLRLDDVLDVDFATGHHGHLLEFLTVFVVVVDGFEGERGDVAFGLVGEAVEYLQATVADGVGVAAGYVGGDEGYAVGLGEDGDGLVVRGVVVPEAHFGFEAVFRDFSLEELVEDELVVAFEHFFADEEGVAVDGVEGAGDFEFQPVGDGAVVHFAEEHDVGFGELADHFAVGDGVALCVVDGVCRFVLLCLEAEGGEEEDDGYRRDVNVLFHVFFLFLNLVLVNGANVVAFGSGCFPLPGDYDFFNVPRPGNVCRGEEDEGGGHDEGG